MIFGNGGAGEVDGELEVPVDGWSRPAAPVLFDAFPVPCVLLDSGWVIRAVNAAYLTLTGRSRETLVGRPLFEAFPDAEPSRTASENVRRVLDRAVRTGRVAVLGAQRYDISAREGCGDLQMRYWTTTAVPIADASGEVGAVLQLVHDVTGLAQNAQAAAAAGQPRVRDLFRAAVEVTEQLRLFDDSVIAERQLGLAVQDAMLPTHIPSALAGRVVVRYRPSSDVLNVGGDWYDVSELTAGRFAVAVGDVVGHGLNAAVVMGQLRSALNALTLLDLGPGAALTGLDRFARQDSDAVLTTALKVIVDTATHTLTYSSAGHLPAVLLDADGTVTLLDKASGPALALPVEPALRPEARRHYQPGARLVLYTDGLIERRDEAIDVSVHHLAERLRQLRRLDPAEMADHLLSDVPPTRVTTTSPSWSSSSSRSSFREPA